MVYKYHKFAQNKKVKLSLSEHIQRSREAVAANKAKGNKHAELFATMYTQPSRFIEEILQNTEDAYIRKDQDDLLCPVRFKLFADKVEIHHNGKDFDEDDLMSVTTFANTTKKNNSEVNLIGKFGIGFKSVFSITEFPEIHCGGYHYKIEDYEVLTACRPLRADAGFSTLIVLPFKRKGVEECYAAVKQGLIELNAYHLLFLKKLNRIEVFEKSNLLCGIERNQVRLKKNVEKRIILKKTYSPDVAEEDEIFLVYTTEGHKQKQMSELAFKVQEREGAYFFEPIKDSPLFVYFPLKMYSGLNFLIHAPFTTNPLRDFALFDPGNCPENIIMLNNAVRSFVSALSEFKKTGLYTIDFLAGLFIGAPLNESSDKQRFIILEKFFNALKDFLRSDGNIPLGKNKFAGIGDVLIPQDHAIYWLLVEADLTKLFQKRFFIDPSICSEEMTEFRNFLSNDLNIKTVDAESFGFRIKITAGFMDGKPVKWLKELYKYLHSQQKLWDVQHADLYYSLRTAPLILTNRNTFEAAYDNGQHAKVFLPGGRKDLLPVVHHKLLADEDCAAFFKALEIKKPDAFAEVVYNIIPQFGQGLVANSKDYYNKLESILVAYSEASHHQKDFLIELLKNTAWVYAEDVIGNKSFSFPDQVYLKNEFLVPYFKSCFSVRFMHSGIFLKLSGKYPGIADKFVKDVGIADVPGVRYTEDHVPVIDGFDDFISFIDFKRSVAFAKILLHASENYFQDDVLQFLRKQRWVLDRQGRFVAPETMNLKDISDKYKFSGAEMSKFIILMGINSEKKVLKDQNIPWKPRLTPNEIDLNTFIGPDPSKSEIHVDINLLHSVQTSLNLFEPMEIDLKVFSEDDLDKIHQWSREFLIRFLQNEFPSPEFIIEPSNIADWKVSKNGEEYRYVFFSSKTDLMNHYQFSAGQFINIMKLSDTSEMTFLYCIGGAGTSSVSLQILQNPFALFISEKVRFRGNIYFSI